jgi:hypothetical protein
MTKDFSEVMSQRSDKELAEILTTKRHEYQEDAIKAAQAELEKRNLDVNSFVTVDDMKKIETKLAPVPKVEQKFNLLYKILTFMLPGPVTALWGFICNNVLEAPLLKGLSLPIVIIIQVIIFKQLKTNGYDRLALDFKKWTLNSWIFFVALFIIIFVLESILRHG